ncbi:DUF2982 domain-containing protein [Rheinheimera baltica]|uniref:DUF2982 domain-containing protein n=1 Tax=Rheinheimera baltica TaxID=67576 RepID=UPI00273DDE59|nr:DUF2982 domain-containing protein [Rheinheimera baltica]MDP5148580.1 DUF2982 domain-containing protein [Rheinheimera baltica]
MPDSTVGFSPIRVQGAASRGGASLMLGSSVVMLLFILSLILVEQMQPWQGLVFVGAGLGMFAGWAKLSEPEYFLQFDSDGVRYQHRRGSWLLPWDSFLYSGIPQFNQQSLGFIGFNVTDYDGFLQHLPLRLAVRIMTEQRALYIEAVRQGCAGGQCASEMLAEVANFSTKHMQYNGIKAAFAHRMQRLSNATGFDVFIPVSFNETEAQQLCRQINQTRLQLTQNTAT